MLLVTGPVTRNMELALSKSRARRCVHSGMSTSATNSTPRNPARCRTTWRKIMRGSETPYRTPWCHVGVMRIVTKWRQNANKG
jgi:hypothetical protein